MRLLGLSALGLVALASAAGAQSVRLASWGGYEGVTDGAEWTVAGAELAWESSRGHAVWGAAEFLSRFDLHDAVQRLGAVIHPAPRWWLTVEAGTAVDPEFAPKNSWEADVTARASRRATLGVGYRRQSYVAGGVDLVTPHAELAQGRVIWETRLYLSRNPSRRTDVAGLLRATASLGPRARVWLGGAAGRESYLVGGPPAAEVRSLRTATGLAGVRYVVGGLAIRLDATVIRSRPVLSRRGAALRLEQRF